MPRRFSAPFLLAAVCLLLPGLDRGADGQSRKPLDYGACNRWQSIGQVLLTPKGDWVAYTLTRQEGDGGLVIRQLPEGKELREPRGSSPVLSQDGRFLAFSILPATADVEKARKANARPEDQPKSALGVLNLATSEITRVDRVRSFRLPAEGPPLLAYLKEPARVPPTAPPTATPAPPRPPAADVADLQRRAGGAPAGTPAAGTTTPPARDNGSDLVIRDLSAGTEAVISRVREYVWTRDGGWLALHLAGTVPAGDGISVRSTKDGKLSTVATGAGTYRSLTLADGGGRLAYLFQPRAETPAPAPGGSPAAVPAPAAGTAPAPAPTPAGGVQPAAPANRAQPWSLMVAKVSEGGARVEPPVAVTWTAESGIPDALKLSENRAPAFSKDGERLSFGVAQPAPTRPTGAPEPLKVDVWSSVDPLLQPMQQVQAETERRKTFLAVAHLDDRKVVALAGPDLPQVTLSSEQDVAIGEDDRAYRRLISWDTDYADYTLVRVKDGRRRKILTRSSHAPSLSPGGKFATYFDEARNGYVAVRTSDGKEIVLTGKIGPSLRSETWDLPAPPSPYGLAGWTKGDETCLVYDRFDIWEIDPDRPQEARRVTANGREKGWSYRYQALDPEERGIPRDRPVLLTVTNESTRATGFAWLTLRDRSEPRLAIMRDAALGRVLKARDSDTLLFSQSRFEQYPDLWHADAGFQQIRKVSDANPQQAEYRWGKAELIDFASADGEALKAVLVKPHGMEPGRKYPLMVYIYERQVPFLHAYTPPAPGTGINFSRYVSNGYLLLRPDITYRTGFPGESALKCVIPAVQKAISLGIVDPARIAIQGHSWGGYQITHLVTRTNLFRCVEAGASVSNMVSAYGGIRWESGRSRAFQYEKGQSRIGAPPWEDPLKFIENSPIFWVSKVQTPYLTLHNDADGAVPWYQGIEFVTALRRLGKEAFLFNYNGEGHGLRQRENMKHWSVHMDEFFDHYLLGKARPEWMDRGVPYLERGVRDVRPLFGDPSDGG